MVVLICKFLKLDAKECIGVSGLGFATRAKKLGEEKGQQCPPGGGGLNGVKKCRF